MKKEQFLSKIEQAWDELCQSYSGLSAEQMQQPGVAGEWSVKDILGHVSAWEAESLKFLPVILEGGRTPRYSQTYGGIDAFNAQMSAQARGLSLAETLAQSQATHRRLMEYLRGVPDEQFAKETRFRRRLRYDSSGHYPEHARAIAEWRSKL